MSHFRVTLYIPTLPEKAEHYVTGALTGFTACAGGATATDTRGAYALADGTLCYEPITQVATIVTNETLGIAQAFAEKYAHEIKTALAQESVLVTVEPVTSLMFV